MGGAATSVEEARLPEGVSAGADAGHLAPGGTALLSKGREWQAEVDAARAAGWTFGLDARPSATDPSARVLVVTEPRHG